MPYISLQDQGFYEPFKAIAQAGANFQEHRRQKRLDEQDSQDRELRRSLLQQQLEGLKFEQKTRADQAGFTPKVRSEGRYDIVETGPGQFDVRERKPTLEDLQRITGGGAPAAPGQPPAGPTPGYRIKLGPDGTPTLDEVKPTKIVRIEQVPVPGGEPILAEVTREGESGPVVGINPVNINRVDANKPLGDEALAKFNAAQFALSQLPDLERTVNEAGHAGGPMAGRLRRLGDVFAGQNPVDRQFGSLAARTLAPIAKGVLGETGVLSDQDIKRIEPLLPTYTDTFEARQAKVQKLKEVLGRQVGDWLQMMKAAGRNTENLTTAIQPKIDALSQPTGTTSSPVGTIKPGRGGKSYKKATEGPDADRSTWVEVVQ